MDIVSPEKRSEMMSHIRSKDTRPEIKLRNFLFKRGFRYRIHVSSLPGRPDIVLPKYKSVILVHGCFWHQHEGCNIAKANKARNEFWTKKFEKNIERDKNIIHSLETAGWRVLIVWECEISKNNSSRYEEVVSWIKNGSL